MRQFDYYTLINIYNNYSIFYTIRADKVIVTDVLYTASLAKLKKDLLFLPFYLIQGQKKILQKQWKLIVKPIYGYNVFEKRLVVNEKTIDLAKYFNVASSEWIYDDSGKTTGDKTLKYILDDETYNVIEGSTLTINQPGEITLVMQHTASGQSEAIKIIALNSFDIVDKDNNQILKNQYIKKRSVSHPASYIICFQQRFYRL